MCSLDITENAEKPEQDKYKVRYHHNLQRIYKKKKKDLESGDLLSGLPRWLSWWRTHLSVQET